MRPAAFRETVGCGELAGGIYAVPTCRRCFLRVSTREAHGRDSPSRDAVAAAKCRGASRTPPPYTCRSEHCSPAVWRLPQNSQIDGHLPVHRQAQRSFKNYRYPLLIFLGLNQGTHSLHLPFHLLRQSAGTIWVMNLLPFSVPLVYRF